MTLFSLRERFAGAVGGLSPVFWAIWLGSLVNRMANFVGPFLAIYLRQQHGFGEDQAGWVVGLWGLGGTVAAPICGALTDHLGRRATMVLGLVSSAITTVAIASVSHPLLLTLLAFLGGAAQACFFPASNAAIADVVPTADRQRAFGLSYWAMNLGLAFGFAVAGLVPTKFLFWLFLADAATTCLCAAVIAYKVPETRPVGCEPERGWSGLTQVLSDRVYVVFCILHTCALVVFTQFQLALPLDMANHQIASQGFSRLMAFNCIGVVLIQPWLTPQLRRVDPSRLLAVSTLLFGVGYGLNAVVSTLPMYLLGTAFWTVGEVVGFPAASQLVADLAPLSVRGRYQGVFAMVWGLGMTLSPILGGQIMRHSGAPTLWWSCLAVGVFVAIGHLMAAPSRRVRTAVQCEVAAHGA